MADCAPVRQQAASENLTQPMAVFDLHVQLAVGEVAPLRPWLGEVREVSNLGSLGRRHTKIERVHWRARCDPRGSGRCGTHVEGDVDAGEAREADVVVVRAMALPLPLRTER